MKRLSIIILTAVLFSGTLFSCGKRKAAAPGGFDTLSYIVGMNVGYELLKMDSTLNVEAVCAAIRDVYASKPKMTLDEARNHYLAEKTYFVHSRVQAHQERFLADMVSRDRSFVRTRSGVTYKIEKLGTQTRQTTMSARDTVQLIFTLRGERGNVLVEEDTLRDSYRNLVAGLQEVIRLAGDGAKFEVWLPSKMAYKTAGNEEYGVGPNELLHFEVQKLQIKYNNPPRKR